MDEEDEADREKPPCRAQPVLGSKPGATLGRVVPATATARTPSPPPPPPTPSTTSCLQGPLRSMGGPPCWVGAARGSKPVLQAALPCLLACLLTSTTGRRLHLFDLDQRSDRGAFQPSTPSSHAAWCLVLEMTAIPAPPTPPKPRSTTTLSDNLWTKRHAMG